MIGSTTESSTQSLMDTPGWLPATFCHGALSAWPQPCGRLTTPGRISSVTATRTSPRWTRLSRIAITHLIAGGVVGMNVEHAALATRHQRRQVVHPGVVAAQLTTADQDQAVL